MRQGRREKGAGSALPQSVLISANSFWNITNFRAGLVEALSNRGYRVLIAAPDADPDWARARGAEAVGITVDRSSRTDRSTQH